MDQTVDQGSILAQISNAVVALHKEHFGRGPTQARSSFAGPDALVCILENVLLPAERKLVALGDPGRVRDTRVALQAATAEEFCSTVEEIVGRKITAFASGVDPDGDVVFENFSFERTASADSSH
jgi:uncharacterized protein YbcI